MASRDAGRPACGRQARSTETIMWYIYILKLRDGSYYKGLTNNLKRRLQQHRVGQSNSTKNKLPFKLIYSEQCSDRIEAHKREKYFKSGQGRDEIKRIDLAGVAELADAQS